VIDTISVIGGNGKKSVDLVNRVDFKMGDVISIVGPTGSGKTTFINDIELFADGSTPSRRKVLINNEIPDPELRDDPRNNPISLITQHTTCLSDMIVQDFLETHISVRNDQTNSKDLLQETFWFANQLTGEAINPNGRMTELSGGQTRSLLIADAAIICNTPIVLLDEVENAGIHRSKAIELLRRYSKIFIFVTHDPRIALLSDYRIVMNEGRMVKIIHINEIEKELCKKVILLDNILVGLRDKLRFGEQLNGKELEGII